MELLSEQEVRDRLAASGIDVSRSRFTRWKDTGLFFASGSRSGLGQGKGRTAHRYSSEVIEQIAQISKMLKDHLDFPEIGWRLWKSGYEVDRKYWFEILATTAEQYDLLVDWIRRAQDSDDLNSNLLEDLAQELYRAKTSNRLIKQVRKSLGRERFTKFIFDIANMATGHFVSISAEQETNKDYDKELRTMDLALGFGHAKTDCLENGPTILAPASDYSPVLREAFCALKQTTLSKVFETSDVEQLRSAAQITTQFFESIATASSKLDEVYRPDTFGLKLAAKLAQLGRNEQALFIIIITLNERSNSGPLDSMRALTHLFFDLAYKIDQYQKASARDANLKPPKIIRRFSRK